MTTPTYRDGGVFPRPRIYSAGPVMDGYREGPEPKWLRLQRISQYCSLVFMLITATAFWVEYATGNRAKVDLVAAAMLTPLTIFYGWLLWIIRKVAQR